MFTLRCSPRARKFPTSGQLFCTTYGCEATGASKFPNFRILAYFPLTKRLKKSPLRWPACRLGVTSHAEWFRFFNVTVEGPKGCLMAVEFSCSGRGAGTPKLAQIFAYGKCLYPYKMLLHGASNLDKRCLKTRNSKDGCTFPPNIIAPAPKIPQNSILGIFQCKTYYRESSPWVAC